MTQYNVANLQDLTASTTAIADGQPQSSVPVVAWMRDATARIANLNDAIQAQASSNAGTSQPASLQGKLFLNTSTEKLFVDPDGQGADDDLAQRLQAYGIDFATAGTGTFGLGGPIDVNTTAVAASGDLMTYAIPADMLSADKVIFVSSFGTVAAGLGVYESRVSYFFGATGTSGLPVRSDTISGTDWFHRAAIICKSGSQISGVFIRRNLDAYGATNDVQILNPSESYASAITSKMSKSGTGISGTVSQEGMTTQLYQ